MFRKIRALIISYFCLVSGISYYYYYHHYVPCELKKIYITLEHLPKEWEGLTIGQLSDIHCGNFRKTRELEEAIDLLMAEKPDLVFITGDVIERYLEEMERLHPLLAKIKAPEGVFSVLGNHEYGPTHLHTSRDGERITKIQAVHQAIGWDLLLNANKLLTRGKQQVAIIGVENYSTGLFPSYGDLTKASQGTEKASIRLLLSHDPSHWRAEVIDADLPIDLMLAGHTHGFKFKITRGHGNPLHTYPEYHGLYQERGNHLYVSSGIGNSKKWGRWYKKREVVVIILKKGVPTA